MRVVYLTLEQVLAIHDDQIERYGGSHGLRDLALLESAVMRPQAGFAGNDLYVTICEKAAALMHSLVANHPFVDGNKRTGVVAGIAFLERNGLSLGVKQEALVKMALQVASGEKGVGELTEWLEERSVKR